MNNVANDFKSDARNLYLNDMKEDWSKGKYAAEVLRLADKYHVRIKEIELYMDYLAEVM